MARQFFLALFLSALVLGVGFFPVFSGADEDKCPGSGRLVRPPEPVRPSSVLVALMGLKTLEGKAAIDLTSKRIEEAHHIFDLEQVRTKMEQFYRLLYLLNESVVPAGSRKMDFDPTSAKEVLLSSKVFADPEVPSQITGVFLDRSDVDRPRFTVTFDGPRMEVLLNGDQGFYQWVNGMCNHAKKLIFYKTFSVSIEMNEKGNVLVSNFEGVDLYGDFGSRGMFDIDINYIAFKEVEFFKGTVNGLVTAKVSREEFKKNDHNPLLQLITNFISDRSVQPIDW